MSKDKKEKVDKEEEVGTPKKVFTPITESAEKTAFRKRIEAYEVANPEAWKIRGERLQATLDSLV